MNDLEEQLRAMGIPQEQMSKVMAEAQHMLREFGSAYVMRLPDGTFRASNTHPAAAGIPGVSVSPNSAFPGGLPEEQATTTPAQQLQEDIALYVDVKTGLEATDNEDLTAQLERVVSILEDKLSENVEDYIAHAQLNRHKAESARAKRQLDAWKADVAAGQTTQAFNDWVDSQPEL